MRAIVGTFTTIIATLSLALFFTVGAAAGEKGNNGQGQAKGQNTTTSSNSGTSDTKSNNGKSTNKSTTTSSSSNSQAPANASKGMNREGSPGEWKGNGHQPSENSYPQGKSPSDPDHLGNGGRDKPGESGGFDADKDGNNGCGNDTDREDDNNGWCGLKPRPEVVTPPPPVRPPTSVTPPDRKVTPGLAAVLGKRIARPSGEVAAFEVALPVTGTPVRTLTMIAFVTLLAGAALHLASRLARRTG